MGLLTTATSPSLADVVALAFTVALLGFSSCFPKTTPPCVLAHRNTAMPPTAPTPRMAPIAPPAAAAPPPEPPFAGAAGVRVGVHVGVSVLVLLNVGVTEADAPVDGVTEDVLVAVVDGLGLGVGDARPCTLLAEFT